jgi:hypothetical protein
MDHPNRFRGHAKIDSRTLALWRKLTGDGDQMLAVEEDFLTPISHALVATVADLADALEGVELSPKVQSAIRGVVAALILECKHREDATGALYDLLAEGDRKRDVVKRLPRHIKWVAGQ